MTEQASEQDLARLTGGDGFWRTHAVAGLRALFLSDGPHGLRVQDGSRPDGSARPATCFPPAVALAATWSPDLARRVGAAIGEEARELGVDVVLGPGVNLKRIGLCGRNFEYFSEDPVLASEIAAAFVQGVQSRGVGTSVKHFACNNQETDRFEVSADVDERPLRELYLRTFERIVRAAAPWTVMCAYNSINGVRCSESRWLLTDVLRGEWGFDGVVVSDWGAVVDRPASLRAGLDLQMPDDGGVGERAVEAALADGSLDALTLRRASGRIEALLRRCDDGREIEVEADLPGHHALAREAAAKAIVLLKNDAGLLPLAEGASIAVVGEFAREPRFQGSGSSRVNATLVETPLGALREAADVVFAPGYRFDGEPDQALVDEAVAAARRAGRVVAFLGLADRVESEGFDRADLSLPADQLALLDALLAVTDRVVVVLTNGSAVAAEGWADRVGAIVEAWLLGQAGGPAVADVLVGRVNPSGRTAETLPWRLEDSPAYLGFPGEDHHVRYGDGLFLGYRGYDARRCDVAFPFGHGLSYTTFGYSDLVVEPADGGLRVRVTVTNTGAVAGREVAQVYVGLPGSRLIRAPRELKGFAEAELAPGEARELSIAVEARDLAYWSAGDKAWFVEGGEYRVEVGASSRDIRATATVSLPGDEPRRPLSLDTRLVDAFAHPVVGERVRALFDRQWASEDGGELGIDPAEMVRGNPLRRVFTEPQLPELGELLAEANRADGLG